jgi:DNA invertase Pin-like site-specific DNA recombinase
MKSRKHLAVGYKSPTFSREPDITIEAYCEQNGLELVKVFSDDKMSSHLQLDQRPSGSELFGYCRRERIRIVVAPNLYNLFKDSVDAGRQLSKWWKRVRLHLINFAGHPFIVEGEAGLAFTRMAEALGKMERRNIRERIASSIARRKVLGYVYGGIPYGYDRVGSLLIENDEEQKVKKRMKDLKKGGMSLNAIASLLNSEGVRTKKSGKWYASTVFSALQSGRRNAYGDVVEGGWAM